MPSSSKRTIGQVIPLLQNEFPDISVSKLRYLEKEGLIAPERVPNSGYRRYSEHDIERLVYILRAQRDGFRPLKVIRQDLEMMDAGMEPPRHNYSQSQAPAQSEPDEVPATQTRAEKSEKPPVRMTRRELLEASGISEAMFVALERQRMVSPRRGSAYYGQESLTLCVAARRLADYGMNTRHLRVIKDAVEREAGLIEQAAAPYLGSSRKVSAQAIQEITKLVVYAHAALMQSTIDR